MNLGVMNQKRKLPRTDLAVELKDHLDHVGENTSGIHMVTREVSRMHITHVEIYNRNGEMATGKKKGHYITIEADMNPHWEEERENQFIKLVTYHLKDFLYNERDKKIRNHILVAGLGNAYASPDALGPLAVRALCPVENKICGIIPGVMATTGLESARIIRGVVEEVKPEAVIVIDALMAKHVKRLCTTVQISNTGIYPGSGVGNHRMEISKETIGVPVIAVGIPTVVEAKCVVGRTENNPLFLTTKDMGEWVEYAAMLLAKAIMSSVQ